MSASIEEHLDKIRDYITLLELRLEYEKYSDQLDLSDHFEAIHSHIWTIRTWNTIDILRAANDRLSFTIRKDNHKYKLFYHHGDLIADSKYLYDLLRDYPLEKLIEIQRDFEKKNQ